MIYLADLSPLMQRAIVNKITFMASESGQNGYYNLYFAKYVDGKGNSSVRLTFHEEEGKIYQYADIEHPKITFDSIDAVSEFVNKEFGIDAEEKPCTLNS